MKKILIGMPSSSGQVSIKMLQSLLQIHKPASCAFASVERQRVDKARNMIAMQALKGGFDYLFFVDDDNPIPPETLEIFIKDDKDVVIAPILTRSPDSDGKHKLCAFYKEELRVGKRDIPIYFNIEEFKDSGPLHKIDAAGTGCMLIKRVVLEKMYKEYQEYFFEFGDIRFKPKKYQGKTYDRRTTSEDCEFSERVINLGFEIWLDERIRPIHLTDQGFVRWGNG